MTDTKKSATLSLNGESYELPMPGTFIISPDGTISLAFAHADYTARLEPATLLDELRKLSA